MEKIIYLKLDEIKPYKKNPRKNKKAVDKVAESIKQFGFRSPIVLDKDKVIICGHTRYEASLKLKLEKVPCIIADDLTEEQVKAYRLADNKVSEFAEWDFDLLDEEMQDILNIDMSDFGFEFVDAEEEHEKQQKNTQERVANILNLGKAQFTGVGDYDIPEIQPEYDVDGVTEWIGFNYVLSDKNPEGKGVHFFIDDYQFERLWSNPDRYIEKLKEYECVIAPDFSPYGDMPLATQLYNHYRKHWIACYMQLNGIKVIPCIRASTDERSLKFYLDGEPKKSVVCISSMWASKNKEYFLKEYNTMFDTLKPCKVLVYGKPVDGLRGNIEYIENFTSKRWSKK